MCGFCHGTTFGEGGHYVSTYNGTTAELWIVYDIGPAAIDGHVVGSQVNNGDVTVSGGQAVSAFANIVSSGIAAGRTIQVDATAPTADTSMSTE